MTGPRSASGAVYGEFAGALSREELDRFFFLDDADKGSRGDASQRQQSPRSGPESVATLTHSRMRASTRSWQRRERDFSRRCSSRAKWPTVSIEIKATRAPAQGAPRHRITTLDQLDAPEQGDLYLFSLRVTPDPIGRHLLPDLVERLGQRFGGELETIELWNERLARARYSPAHADRYREPVRIVAQELFRVEHGFPRIIRTTFPDGVPAGVDDIGYTINLAACQPFRVATGPHDPATRRVLDAP